MKDLTGQRFGRLVALEPTDERRGGYIVWKCRCDCGNIKLVPSSSLRNGHTKSCGCLHKDTFKKDLLNKRFGFLTVVEELKTNKDGLVMWKCKCDCGKEFITSSHILISGTATSCGCQKGKTTPYKSGDKIGYLTIIEDTKKRKYGHILWKCKCQCGKEIVISSRVFTEQKVPSCGCLQNSQGEEKIINILTENQIPYEKEKQFDNCKFLNTNKPAKFDFYVNNEYLIEFDGIQHFQPIEYFGGENNFIQNQIRDKFKNQWCKDNNIPLIRIPYTRLKNLCLEDLLLETSSFLL